MTILASDHGLLQEHYDLVGLTIIQELHESSFERKLLQTAIPKSIQSYLTHLPMILS